MAAEAHKLAIFRGLLKFKSNQQKIWGVLIFLSIVTTIEVVLGIIKPEALLVSFLKMKILAIHDFPFLFVLPCGRRRS